MNDLRTMDRRAGGYVLDVALRVVLLMAVLGQVVFLASRYRTRIDLTQDQLYSLTDSTRRILGNLDDRLVIEEYFSSNDRLPATLRPYRRMLDDFLDEYRQLSKGKVVIRKFDPQDDSMLRQKAERLRMQPVTLSDAGDQSLAIKEIWQGIRLRYGAQKQEVIPFLDFRTATAQYEALLTPKIKALTIAEKPKIGVLAFATEPSQGSPFGGGGGPGKGFQQLKELTKDRFDLVDVDLSQGQLVPDEYQALLVVRPKRLTDRQKYALDQFLMRGGSMVVFADTNEYEIGQQRTFRGRSVPFDAPDAKLKFRDQLAHYGVKVDDKVVADFLQDAQRSQGEEFAVLAQTMFGRALVPVPYPYWFHAVDIDYADYADRFAAKDLGGLSDGNLEQQIESYKKSFKPGMASDSEILHGMKRGPQMFWPTAVALADPLPDNVTGKVLLRTSPLSIAETPPPDLNPLGWNPRDGSQMQQSLNAFNAKLEEKLRSEPRQQFGLMVRLQGRFTSFFDGKPIPPRKQEDKTAAADKNTTKEASDPLAEPVAETPKLTTAPEKPAAEATAPAAKPEAEKADKDKADKDESATGKGGAEKGDGGNGNDGKAAEPQSPSAPQSPAGQSPTESKAQNGGTEKNENAAAAPAQGTDETQKPQQPEIAGPPAPEKSGDQTTPEEPKDPDPILVSEKPGNLVVVADSDFIRDDLLSGEYAQQGGPVSQMGQVFFGNLVDWLAEDRDLLALRNKTFPDRRVDFAESGPMASLEGDRERYDKAVENRGNLVRWVNVLAPFAAIMLIWLLVALQRRARKQSFLASVEG